MWGSSAGHRPGEMETCVRLRPCSMGGRSHLPPFQGACGERQNHCWCMRGRQLPGGTFPLHPQGRSNTVWQRGYKNRRRDLGAWCWTVQRSQARKQPEEKSWELGQSGTAHPGRLHTAQGERLRQSRVASLILFPNQSLFQSNTNFN